MQSIANQQKIGAIQALRGIASLAVCWFHFTNGNTTFLPAGVLKSSGVDGWMGVEMFFVISGFVIPYALFKGSYQVRNFPRFLVKRIVRLDPPYLASIGLILAVAYASSRSSLYTGVPFELNFSQILLHVGYLNAFFQKGWLNPVFWSLAIEFQYYLLIGLIFPFILSRKRSVRLIAEAGLLTAALSIRNDAFVFKYLAAFLMGILVMQFYVRLIGIRELLLMAVPVIVGCVAALGYKVTLVSVISACALLIPNLHSRLLWFLGDISYSLYLVHVPIGGRIINLSQRFVHGESGKILVLLLALSLSIAFAYLLFRFVEKPSQRLSASLSYIGRAHRRGAVGSEAAPEIPLAGAEWDGMLLRIEPEKRTS